MEDRKKYVFMNTLYNSISLLTKKITLTTSHKHSACQLKTIHLLLSTPWPNYLKNPPKKTNIIKRTNFKQES